MSIQKMESLRLQLITEARIEFHQRFSALRSLASKLKSQGLVNDEELAFDNLLNDHIKAFRNELANLITLETLTDLLNPFKTNG